MYSPLFARKRRTKAEMLVGIDGVTSSRLIGHSTVECILSNGDRMIRYHRTDIVRVSSEGVVVLNSGGYKTRTTLAKINDHLPSGFPRVVPDGAVWKIDEKVFYDGIELYPKGKQPTRSEQDPAGTAESKRAKRLSARIEKMITTIKKMPELPKPYGGDCFICSMGLGVGAEGRLDCIESHLMEQYIHGTLLVNAMRACGRSDSWIRGCLHSVPVGQRSSGDRRFVIRDLRRYLRRQTGLSSY